MDCQSCWRCAGSRQGSLQEVGTPGVRASGCIPGPTAQLTGTWPPLLQGHSHPLMPTLVQSLSSTSFPSLAAHTQGLCCPGHTTALPRLGLCPSPSPACRSPRGDDGRCGNTHLLLECLCSCQHWVSVMLLQHRPVTASQRALCPCCIHSTSPVTATL